MKANSINSVRQINPSFIKSIIIFFILVLPILKGYSQEKINIGKMDEKIIGSWVVPTNGIVSQNYSFEMFKNEKSRFPFIFNTPSCKMAPLQKVSLFLVNMENFQ
ncbi:MAG: hypothetical protein IPF63_03825 [Bacteroidetes bacterium]|nr:hypothetical protein [Bacteroidota bacterium]